MSNLSWMSEGYEAVETRAQELKTQQENNGNFIPNFMLADGAEATVLFLTDNPINHYQHFLKSNNRYYTCPQTPDCPLCATGNKPSFSGAYLVIDTRYEEYKNNKGEDVKQQNTVKIMKHGIKALQVIQKQHAKRGLTNFAWEITRTGSGTSTAYSFIPVPLDDFSGVEIPKGEKLEEYRKKMLEQIAPKSAEYIADILAGRNPNQNNNNQGGNTQQQNTGSNQQIDMGEEENSGVLKFL